MENAFRFLIFALIIQLTTMNASAQSRYLNDRSPANRWSVEGQIGIGLPVTPLPDQGEAYIVGLPMIHTGVRYMLTKTLGVRPAYGYHRFHSTSTIDPLSQATVNIHQIGVDIIYSLSGLFPEQRIHNRQWNVLVHAGGHHKFGTLKTASGIRTLSHRDRLVSGRAGGTLQYRAGSRMTLALDLSGYLNVLHDINYDGGDIDKRMSLLITPSVGVQIYLGRHGRHVDWR